MNEPALMILTETENTFVYTLHFVHFPINYMNFNLKLKFSSIVRKLVVTTKEIRPPLWFSG